MYGYWDELTTFIRALFNSTFKTNPYMERAMLTGITRVSKESIFSDLNNLNVITAVSEKYASCFGFTEQEVFDKLMEYKELLAPYVGDAFTFVHNALKDGKNILLEGQLGSLKDTDFGIYPMVTSSNTIAGYGAVGAGIPPYEIKEIITVVKAYSSAVGAGEFVSEIFGDEADELRRRGGDGGEFGATTGRPRRMGWLDLVATRYGCMVQGATQVAFTVLDVLGYLDEIPVCVGYELDGKEIDYFPSTTKLKRCKPILKKLKGWKCSISGITEYDKLPKECREYIEFAEKAIGVPITMVSNGPSRNDIIYR